MRAERAVAGWDEVREGRKRKTQNYKAGGEGEVDERSELSRSKKGREQRRSLVPSLKRNLDAVRTTARPGRIC